MNVWRSSQSLLPLLISSRSDCAPSCGISRLLPGRLSFITTRTNCPLLSSNTHSTHFGGFKHFSTHSDILEMGDGHVERVEVFLGESQHPGESKEIFITKQEQRLFDLLVECVKHQKLDVEVRVAGGWVRDKLLNKSSDDIDIALDTMTGAKFCEHLNAFTEANLGFQKTVGIVRRRPEQSKHLETATLNILGFDVDFVNLRSEGYTETSRIPNQVRLGTPFEDASRRDFTINSIFYNVTRGCIEDWTGLGLQDLSSELIRACGRAYDTFLDDPLRVVRAVRFSSRFGYKLDDEIIGAINQHVIDHLANKVARPRIAQELEHMLEKGNVAQAFEMLRSFNILRVIMKQGKSDVLPSDEQLLEGTRLLQSLVDLHTAMFGENTCDSDPNVVNGQVGVIKGSLDMKYAYLAALVYPFKDEMKTPKISLVEHVVKEAMKLPSRLAKNALSIAQGVEQFHKVAQELDKVQLGFTMRNVGAGLYRESILLACCVANESGHVPGASLYEQLIDFVKMYHLDTVFDLKAPITGQQLLDIVPNVKPGPMFKEALDLQIEHMIRDPAITRDELAKILCRHYSHVATRKINENRSS